MFFQIEIEDIKIISAIECFRGFVSESSTDIRKSKLTAVSLSKRIF